MCGFRTPILFTPLIVCFFSFVLALVRLNTPACCICASALQTGFFSPLWWFSSLADDERSWKSWKGWGYPLFTGPARRRGLFKELFFILTSRENRAALFYSIYHWEAETVAAASQHWCWRLENFTVRSAVIRAPVIGRNYSNRPDMERRWSWCFACALFVARTCKFNKRITHLIGTTTPFWLLHFLPLLLNCIDSFMKTMLSVYENLTKWCRTSKINHPKSKLLHIMPTEAV